MTSLRVADVGRSAMVRRVGFVIGAVVAASGMAMIPSLITAGLYREWEEAFMIAVSLLVTTAIGVIALQRAGRPRTLTTREGFVAVGLAWFAMSIFGTLPYLLTGAIPSLTDAFFETASGFTTTGASIIPDPAALPRAILLWRSTTQWIGGMGVIILSVAILPLLGVGGVQLARAEAPGADPDRLTPRFQETAKRLWLLYLALTLTQILLLALGDMDMFQAVNHAFTTMSTGGFSTEATSIAGFSAYTQWVITVFMFVAGASFALHLRALRNPISYRKSAEFMLYAAIALIGIVVVSGGLLQAGANTGEAVRDASFATLTIVTTTGFTTADFGAWRPALQILIIGLMFVGGMAGSTAGSVKVFRVGILSKAAFNDLRRLIHPRGVFVTRFGSDNVKEKIVESIQSFFLFYMFLFMTATFLLAFIDANTTEDLNFLTSASAVAASIGNIGPGLGDVGPTGNYSDIPVLGKWLLATVMIVGRLEIFPVLVLFTRDVWKR